MIRARAIAFGAIVLAVGAVVFFLATADERRETRTALVASQDASSIRDTTATDTVWYHASDVALLATTGRPQLVEFFHPD